MKLKLGNSIALSMVAMLFLSMMTILPVIAVQPTIYMTDKDGNKYPPNVFPPAPGPYIGFKWNITLWIKDYGTPPVFAWEVRLSYNTTLLNATRAWIPAKDDPEYIFTGRDTARPAPSFFNIANHLDIRVTVGDSLLVGEGETPPPEPAKLAIIEFNITKAPGKHETSSCVLNIDNVATYLLDDYLARITRTAADGSYTWAWTPPPPPRLGVKIEAATGDVGTVRIDSVKNPAKVTYLKSGTAPSNNVTVGVYLKEYNELWGVTLVNFTLCYNSTLLEILEPPIVDTRWTTSSVSNITESTGQLNVTVKDPVPPAPSGDVLLVTVKFHVKYQGVYPAVDTSPLDINTQYAEDHIGPIPLNPPYNGEVVIEGVRVRYLEVKPNRYITDKLETFNVEVWLNNVTESDRVIGAQFRLKYNVTLLEIQNVTEGSFFKQFGTTLFVNYTVLSENDDPINYGLYGSHILVGIVILASDGYTNFPKGSGILATVTFRGIYRSFDEVLKSPLELADIEVVNNETNAIPTTSPKNGIYEIFPLLPMLKVQPQVYEAKKKDESFNINVTIANLDPDTQLNSVNFTLTYNATVLEVLNITEGPFLRGFGNTTFNYSVGFDSVTIQNQLKTFTSFPNGNGTIATITFKAVYRGFYPEETSSTLNLTEIVLLDVSQNKIPTSAPMNGVYKIFSLRRPVARFTYSPSMPLVTQEVVFNASASYDYYPGAVVSYFWHFGDGSPPLNTTNTIVTHAFNASGNYTTTLKVTDNDGLTDTTSQTIYVAELPTASFTYSPSEPYAGDTVTFNATKSHAIDGYIVKYVWDFGDGNTTTVTSSVITHSYMTPATYNVTLTVIDNRGLSNSDTKTVTVTARPVSILLYAVIIAVLATIVILASIVTYYKRIRKHKSRTV
jgi:PKD repeat protein